MSYAKKIVKILRKNKIEFTEPSADILVSDNLLDVFIAVLPNRTHYFDPKCIGEKEVYTDILCALAECTNGEFLPENVVVTGTKEDIISLSFVFNEKKKTLKIEQNDSRWFSDSFVYRLKNFTQRNLPGRFLDIPGDLATFVYLPKAVATKIHKAIFTFHTSDLLAEALETIETIETVYTIDFYGIPNKVQAGYTTQGETIMTHLIKNLAGKNNELLILLIWRLYDIDGSGISYFSQNQHGEAPYELLRDKGLLERVNEIYYIQKTTPYHEYRENRMDGPVCLFEHIKPIVNALDSELKNMRIPDKLTYNFECSHLTEYYAGQSSLTITTWTEPGQGHIGFHILINKGRKISDIINKRFKLDEVNLVIDLVRKYINHELW